MEHSPTIIGEYEAKYDYLLEDEDVKRWLII